MSTKWVRTGPEASVRYYYLLLFILKREEDKSRVCKRQTNTGSGLHNCQHKVSSSSLLYTQKLVTLPLKALSSQTTTA